MFFSSYAFSFCFSCRIFRVQENIEMAVRNEPQIFSVQRNDGDSQNVIFKLTMVASVVSHYLLPLLLTYYCVLAYVTVQADDITLQLIGEGRETKQCLKFIHLESISAFNSELKMTTQDSRSTHRGLDLLGPVGIFQCVVSIIVWVGWGAHIGNHNRPAVATQGVFKYPRQLAVSVWNMSFLTLQQNRKVCISPKNILNFHKVLLGS